MDHGSLPTPRPLRTSSHMRGKESMNLDLARKPFWWCPKFTAALCFLNPFPWTIYWIFQELELFFREQGKVKTGLKTLIWSHIIAGESPNQGSCQYAREWGGDGASLTYKEPQVLKGLMGRDSQSSLWLPEPSNSYQADNHCSSTYKKRTHLIWRKYHVLRSPKAIFSSFPKF